MEGRFSLTQRWLLLAIAFFAAVNGAPPSEPEINSSPLVLSRASPDEIPFPLTQNPSPLKDQELHLTDALKDLVVVSRQKREYYDREPWGRMPEDKLYYRRRGHRKITRYNTRKFSRGRRREQQGYRGEDYGDDLEENSHKITYNGYVDTSAFDNQSEPKRNFVSARASGVARTETTEG